MKKYSVFTFIFNNYEPVREVLNPDPDVEYILVTDDIDLRSDTWTVIFDESLLGLSPLQKNWMVKYHPWKYLSTDLCIRIDGSIQVKESLDNLVDLFNNSKGYDIGLLLHPYRNNFMEEYYAWEMFRGQSPRISWNFYNWIRTTGYDLNLKGLFQTNFCIQRRTPLGILINDTTYNLITTLNPPEFIQMYGEIDRNDQCYFAYIMNTMAANAKILPFNTWIINSPFLQQYHHGNWEPEIYTDDSWTGKYMRGQEVVFSDHYKIANN